MFMDSEAAGERGEGWQRRLRILEARKQNKAEVADEIGEMLEIKNRSGI